MTFASRIVVLVILFHSVLALLPFRPYSNRMQICSFKYLHRQGRSGATTSLMMAAGKGEAINVMVNGMPGPMAVEVARACIERGFNLLPLGFTGPEMATADFAVDSAGGASTTVQLVEGPGINGGATERLAALKSQYPDLIAIDFTTPSAVLNNMECYRENNCDFVMGTTGVEQEKIEAVFEEGANFAVIAPNMAKQIVALQSTLLAMSQRFPGSFSSYKLTVRCNLKPRCTGGDVSH